MNNQLRLFFGRDLNAINTLRHKWRLAIGEASDFRVMIMNLKSEMYLDDDSSELKKSGQINALDNHLFELEKQIQHSMQLADSYKAELKHYLIEKSLSCSPIQLSLMFQQGFKCLNKVSFIHLVLDIKDLAAQIRCTPQLMELEHEDSDLLASIEQSLEESFLTLPTKITLDGQGSQTQTQEKIIKKYPLTFKDSVPTELRFPRSKLNHNKLTQSLNQHACHEFESARHHEHDNKRKNRHVKLKKLDQLSTELILELFPEQ